MGRILLAIAVVVAAFFLLGSLIGLITGLIKWALIIGVVVLAVTMLSKILRYAPTDPRVTPPASPLGAVLRENGATGGGTR
ncbi:hypothetical protein ABGB17_08505 [Sphaerisporangium sp. B11E5]|uniref:hypothetical protein n=1 Tax=Sphaerisporangium sp. B11E5 TaxID=3153563 RepID=UPI00325E7A38